MEQKECKLQVNNKIFREKIDNSILEQEARKVSITMKNRAKKNIRQEDLSI